MKLWRYTLVIIGLIVFTLFSLDNSDMVRINVPQLVGPTTGKSVYLPLYLLITLAIFTGVIIGVFIEYFRNFKIRNAYNENNRKLLKMKKELEKSKEKFLTEEEKIFNLLD